MARNARKSQSKNCGNKKKTAPFGKVHIEIQDGTSGMSPYGGLWSVVKLFRLSGLPEAIDSCIGARNRNRRRSSSECSRPSLRK